MYSVLQELFLEIPIFLHIFAVKALVLESDVRLAKKINKGLSSITSHLNDAFTVFEAVFDQPLARETEAISSDCDEKGDTITSDIITKPLERIEMFIPVEFPLIALSHGTRLVSQKPNDRELKRKDFAHIRQSRVKQSSKVTEIIMRLHSCEAFISSEKKIAASLLKELNFFVSSLQRVSSAQLSIKTTRL